MCSSDLAACKEDVGAEERRGPQRELGSWAGAGDGELAREGTEATTARPDGRGATAPGERGGEEERR